MTVTLRMENQMWFVPIVNPEGEQFDAVTTELPSGFFAMQCFAAHAGEKLEMFGEVRIHDGSDILDLVLTFDEICDLVDSFTDFREQIEYHRRQFHKAESDGDEDTPEGP